MNGYCKYALMGNVSQEYEWLESERLCNVFETTPGSNERRFQGFPSDTYDGTFCNIEVPSCYPGFMVSDETRLSSDFFAHYGCNHDINECEEHGHRCGAHGTCLESYSNTAVSFNAFQCRCDKGWMNGYCEYALMGNVLQTDEWLESERLCNVVETTPGSNERRFSGFPSDTYNGTFCNIDVDECDGNPCADSQLCIDSTDDDTIPIGEYMHRTLATAAVALATAAVALATAAVATAAVALATAAVALATAAVATAAVAPAVAPAVAAASMCPRIHGL